MERFRPLRVANALFVVLFAAAALLQLNDPDPLAWTLVYLAAAAASVGWQLGRVGRRALLAGAAVALGWAAWIGWRMELQAPLGTALLDWGMHAGGSEEAREIGGLLIVVGWLGLLGAASERA